MALSMYSASVPALARMLQNMLNWLDKADQHAQARSFDVNNFIGMRLAPDMLPFVKQVQIACDNAKGAAARLAGVEVPRHEDNEATFDDLRARLRKTIEFVKSVSADKFAGAESRQIVLPLRSGELRFDGEIYLTQFVLPNFYFHATTAYAILRHGGVELGKTDFLGG